VVATAVGGLPALVEHERTGLLVPPRDPDALAAALRTLLGDPCRAARMGDAARARWQERHGWPQVAAAHAALYRALWASRT
jgi:glycosyltransferase involved in cell wall biosynthesis